MIIDELFEAPQQCPECGGISFSDLILAEKKDACYHKVKASAKVWPSAYASGRLVQCRKKGAGNWGNKSEGVAEGSQEDAKFTPRLQIRSRIETVLDQYLDPEKVAGAYTDIQYYKHDGKVYVEVLFNYTDGQKIGPQQRKQFLVNKDFTLTPIKKQGVAEGSDNKVAKHNAAVAKLPGGQAHRSNHPDILKTAPKGYSFSVSHKLVPDEQGVAEGKNTNPRVNEIRQLAKDFFGYKPYSSGTIQGGKILRLSFPFNRSLSTFYHSVPLTQVSPQDQQLLKKLKSDFEQFMASNGVSADEVSLKFHTGAGVYASVRIAIPQDQDVAEEQELDEKWSQKYKSSINCANPRGFSQKAHCAGRNKNESMTENAGQTLSVQQLATISDAALDDAYGYGRSTPGNTFGWQANLKSAAYAKQMIDQGVTDIEAISDAIHKGWNTTAQAFVQDPKQFDDTAKLAAAGKLEAKLQQRAQLMKQNYAQLPEEEKEKDRVVARALLQAIRGQRPGMAEGQLEMNTPDPVVVVQDLKGKILDKLNLSVAAQKYKLGQPQNIKNQLAHQNYTKVGNYMIVSPMSGQPQDATTQGVAKTALDEKSVSQAQFRTMAGAAHNPEFARKVGISQDVAQEFNQADKKSNYKKLPARATEGEQQPGADYRDPKEVDYDDEYDAMVARVKRLAGLGPMKTVYDPNKRVYRNMPTAQQPKK